MDAETRVQDNMNAFASAIAASGVDYHVIVIADTGHINVPPPLGGSPQLLQVNFSIDSHNALQKTVELYPMYQAFLRPLSVKHVVVVSDDESDWSQAMFESKVAAPTARLGTDWRSTRSSKEAPPWDPNSHCFALSAAVGAIYISLQQAHGGLFFRCATRTVAAVHRARAEREHRPRAAVHSRSRRRPTAGARSDEGELVYTLFGGSPMTFPNVGSAAWRRRRLVLRQSRGADADRRPTT
jgi:hypothetical protein